ncbi:endonuclease III [Campylobacter ureolyticus]|nr:endonuclease III [Campylobacter ureolyticus]
MNMLLPNMKYSLEGIKSWKLYHFHNTGETSKIKGICAENDNLILKSDARNISAYLKRLKNNHKEYYEYIVYNISRIAPFLVVL